MEDIVRYDHLSIYGMNPIPLYILHRYKQYGAYGYWELHTTEWYQSYTKEDYFCILYDPL